MEVTHELVTPKKAEAWLNSNTINRTLRPGVVERYAADMKSNRWTNCNAAIAFYDDGNLADGQHRLYAIIESGCSIKFTIHRGLSCEDGLNIDTGLGRSLIDNARISGIEPGITTALVAVCRGIADGEHASNTSRLGRCGYSNSERIAIVQQHRDAGRWVISHGPRGRNVRIGPVMSAVGRAWYVEKDHARLQRFCSIMTNGIYDGDGESAAAALRAYITSKQSLHTSSLWRETFLKAQNCIHYFMREQPLSSVRSVKDEIYPLKKGKK